VQLGAGRGGERVVPARLGQAELRIDGGHGQLVVARLPSLPADRTYEIWLQSGHRAPVPSTRFGVRPDGAADVGVRGDLHRVTRLLVTVEPHGGSRVPTGHAVIVERLS
jgi:anti-sigma-K factor RskA